MFPFSLVVTPRQSVPAHLDPTFPGHQSIRRDGSALPKLLSSCPSGSFSDRPRPEHRVHTCPLGEAAHAPPGHGMEKSTGHCTFCTGGLHHAHTCTHTSLSAHTCTTRLSIRLSLSPLLIVPLCPSSAAVVPSLFTSAHAVPLLLSLSISCPPSPRPSLLPPAHCLGLLTFSPCLSSLSLRWPCTAGLHADCQPWAKSPTSFPFSLSPSLASISSLLSPLSIPCRPPTTSTDFIFRTVCSTPGERSPGFRLSLVQPTRGQCLRSPNAPEKNTTNSARASEASQPAGRPRSVYT